VPAAKDPPETLNRVKSALDIVAKIARQMRRTVGSGITIEELESCGREGLLDAARRYDPSRRVPFRSYACVRIRGAMIDGVRQLMPLPRRVWEKLQGLEAMDRVTASLAEDVYNSPYPATTPEAADQSLSDHLAAMATALAVGLLPERVPGEHGEVLERDAESPEDLVMRISLRKRLEEILTELPSQEAELIRRHYFDGERFDHVAASMGFSKSWGSRLHRRAIDRLSKRLRDE
jgi:RNA polymerase sigma factor for flagellar operon FliA